MSKINPGEVNAEVMTGKEVSDMCIFKDIDGNLINTQEKYNVSFFKGQYIVSKIKKIKK